MYHTHAQLRFECTGCGACCVGNSGYYVAVSDAEAESIRAFLGLSRSWFRRRYLVSLADTQRGLRLGRDGRCPFLLDDASCRVYAMRPRQCRTYPFWPEVLASKRTWVAEATRCEGIGRGPVVTLQRIRACLELEQRDEHRAAE